MRGIKWRLRCLREMGWRIGGRAPWAGERPFNGTDESHAIAELYRPEGTGPFPAIVVLHGGDGINAHYLYDQSPRPWHGASHLSLNR